MGQPEMTVMVKVGSENVFPEPIVLPCHSSESTLVTDGYFTASLQRDLRNGISRPSKRKTTFLLAIVTVSSSSLPPQSSK